MMISLSRVFIAVALGFILGHALPTMDLAYVVPSLAGLASLVIPMITEEVEAE